MKNSKWISKEEHATKKATPTKVAPKADSSRLMHKMYGLTKEK